MFKHKGHWLLAIYGFYIVNYLADARLNIQQRCMQYLLLASAPSNDFFETWQVIDLCLWFVFNSSLSPWSEKPFQIWGHMGSTEVQCGCKETWATKRKRTVIVVNVVCFLDSGNCSWNYVETGQRYLWILVSYQCSCIPPMSLLSRLFFEQEKLFRFGDVVAGGETSRSE